MTPLSTSGRVTDVWRAYVEAIAMVFRRPPTSGYWQSIQVWRLLRCRKAGISRTPTIDSILISVATLSSSEVYGP